MISFNVLIARILIGNYTLAPPTAFIKQDKIIMFLAYFYPSYLSPHNTISGLGG